MRQKRRNLARLSSSAGPVRKKKLRETPSIWFQLVRKSLLGDQRRGKEDISPTLMISMLTFQNLKETRPG